jgi:hypothetical protein
MVGRSENFARARRLAGQYGRPVLFVRDDREGVPHHRSRDDRRGRGTKQADLSREIARMIEELISSPRVRERAIRLG